MLGIIGAMPEEIEFLKNEIHDLKETNYYSLHFYEGLINSKQVVLMQSGIGKVNASFATTVLLEKYNIEYIINIGTAGGVNSNCEVLDIVLSKEVCYHDVDVTAFNYEYGQIPNCPLYFPSDNKLLDLAEEILLSENLKFHKGLIVSGDAFINENEQIMKIKKHFFDCLAVEMEASAIGHVCYLYKKPFIIIRSLSDIAGKKSNISFNTYMQQSSRNSGNLVLKLIEKL